MLKAGIAIALIVLILILIFVYYRTYNQGVEQLKRGYYGEAIKAFTQVVRVNPSDAEAYIHRGFAPSTPVQHP